MERGRQHGLLICGVLLGSLTLSSGGARADCLSLVSGPVQYDVTQCIQIAPEQTFDLTKERFAWIGDLDPQGKKDLYGRYRGLYLKGRVVKSTAVAKGISGEKRALYGDQVSLMILPGQSTCANVQGKRLAGTLKEICCDGGGDPPCLLGTSYLLQSLSVLGAASSSAGDTSRQKSAKSADYKAATTALKAGKWKDAARLYEKVKAEGEIDVRGYYNLGFAYRKLDQCSDAVQPLKTVHDAAAKKQISADEEGTARKASMLLARCYSKMNEPGLTILLLQGYLLEPQKYRSEIKESLSNKDFGWIHTSREYRDYKKDALKKLKN